MTKPHRGGRRPTFDAAEAERRWHSGRYATIAEIARDMALRPAGRGAGGVMAHLVMHPSRRTPGLFSATLDGVEIVRSTRQPFLDGARALLAMGHAPDEPLTSAHVGSETVALRSTVGEAARWTIFERDRGGLGKALWMPRSSFHGDARTGDEGLGGTSEPPTTIGAPRGLKPPSSGHPQQRDLP